MCIFCEVQKVDVVKRVEDTILHESKSFYSKPALGHFIEGYTLINTKKHVPNFSHYFKKSNGLEFKQFLGENVRILKKIYKKDILIFEHGSLNKMCSNECSVKCIDHAHIHLVPFSKDISHLIDPELECIEISDVTNLQNYTTGPYIYYEFSGNRKLFVLRKHVQSQYLRKLLANVNGHNQWNWRKYDFREKIQDFIVKFNLEKDLVDSLEHISRTTLKVF